MLLNGEGLIKINFDGRVIIMMQIRPVTVKYPPSLRGLSQLACRKKEINSQSDFELGWIGRKAAGKTETGLVAEGAGWGTNMGGWR